MSNTRTRIRRSYNIQREQGLSWVVVKKDGQLMRALVRKGKKPQERAA